MSDGMSDGRDYGPFLSKHGAPIVSQDGKPVGSLPGCWRCKKSAPTGLAWVEIGDAGYDLCEACRSEMTEVLVKWFAFRRCPSKSPGTELQCEREEAHSICRGCGYPNCKYDEHYVTRPDGKTTWFSCGAVLTEKKQ